MTTLIRHCESAMISPTAFSRQTVRRPIIWLVCQGLRSTQQPHINEIIGNAVQTQLKYSDIANCKQLQVVLSKIVLQLYTLY